MTTTDELAIKLYGLIDTERLAEEKRRGNALGYFSEIARELLQGTSVRREIPTPRREESVERTPVPQRRIRESDLEASRVEERRTRRRTTSPTSVDEGVRVSPL